MDEMPEWVRQELKARGRAGTRLGEPRALAARYDRKNRRIVVDLDNGCVFAFPPAKAQGLAGATAARLAEVAVVGRGSGLHWPSLDADLSVGGLLSGLFGSKAWMREMGRRGGASSSEAKRAAARENGRKGGRPRKAA